MHYIENITPRFDGFLPAEWTHIQGHMSDDCMSIQWHPYITAYALAADHNSM